MSIALVNKSVAPEFRVHFTWLLMFTVYSFQHAVLILLYIVVLFFLVPMEEHELHSQLIVVVFATNHVASGS